VGFFAISAAWGVDTIGYVTHLKKCSEEKKKDLLAEISLLSTILFELFDRYWSMMLLKVWNDWPSVEQKLCALKRHEQRLL
jgi:hypothetical protein